MRSPIDTMVSRARVLASPTRVNIWCSVGPDGAHPMELARLHGIAPSTVTFHLTILKRAKLVEVVGSGRSRVYRWTAKKLAIVTEAELMAITATAANPTP